MKYHIVIFCVLICFACNNVENQVVETKKKSTTKIRQTKPINGTVNQVDKRGFKVKLGEKAPDFDFTLTNGKKAKLSDFAGKPIMLQFTASWCGVCIKEMPHIENEIWKAYRNEGLIVLAIDRDEPLAKAKELIKKTKITYPVALDPGAEIFGKFASKKSGVTRNVIIDKNGEIVFLTRLYDPKEFKAMIRKIKSIL